jgi:RHS repeat-associated protein
LHEFVDAGAGDFWAQRLKSPVATSGSTATINDSVVSGSVWNIAAVEVKASASKTVNYAYTTQGRLSTAIQKTGATTTGQNTYCYDANANLTSTSNTISATCPGSAVYTYDGANQVLSQPFGTHHTYDLDGNETDVDSNASGSTQRRQTSYVNGDQASSFTVGATAFSQAYLANTNNERLTSTTATAVDHIQTSPLGISSITHGTDTAHTVYVTRDPSGGLIGYRVGTGSGGTKYYFQTDRLGSVLRVLNASGATVNTYDYNPYGKTTSNEGNTQPFTYTGGYNDPATGLLKLGARYYDPTQARFTQTDPQTHPGDTNQSSPYPYAGDDPINHTDPEGSAVNIGGCIGLVLSGCLGVSFGHNGIGFSASAGLGFGEVADITIDDGEPSTGPFATVQGCLVLCGTLSGSNGSITSKGAGLAEGGGVFITEGFQFAVPW